MASCTTCGQPHPKCSAHSKRTGGPCGAQPMAGQQVCKTHGGKSPQALAKAGERIARTVALGQVGELLEEMGHEPVPHPLDGLEWAYGRAYRMVRVLDLLVGERESLITWRQAGEHAGYEAVHPLVSLHGEWVDRYTRIQKLALDAGVDERRTRLQEADIEAMFSAFVTALNAAGLTPGQQEAVRVALANEFRRIAPAGAS